MHYYNLCCVHLLLSSLLLMKKSLSVIGLTEGIASLCLHLLH